MSRIVKLAAAAIAIALTAAIVGIAAYDGGRAAPRQRSVRYDPNLESTAPAFAWSLRGPAVQAQPSRYRLRPAPNAVIELGPRPRCHYLTWRTTRTGSAGG
jgi:hypothetical protein